MEGYFLILMLTGIAALGMAWMPAITGRIQISYAVIYVLLGILLFRFVPGLPASDPILHNQLTLHITEIVVIISLMGTGLKIDQPFRWKTWKIPIKLATITMLLCICLLALLAIYYLKFDWPSALLLGAALAPTDPVLASDVQVGPPLESSENTVRFALTGEAGLNDGMAFPFTWLAILMVGQPIEPVNWISWFLLFKIGAGVLIGFICGRMLAYLLFDIPKKLNLLFTRDGFVAFAATLIVYGITELLHGYGFIAVFVTAITIRNYQIGHKYHIKLHSFIDELERPLLGVVLILFGGTIVNGILDHLTWELAVTGLLFIFIIRPAAGYLTLAGSGVHWKEKLAISFFGIRGMGSFFYLAFALSQTKGFRTYDLWALVSFIVLLSVIIHGFTASSLMKKLSEEFERPSRIKPISDPLPGNADPSTPAGSTE